MQEQIKQSKVEAALTKAVHAYSLAVRVHYNGRASWHSHPGTQEKLDSTRLWLRGLLRGTGRMHSNRPL